MAAPVYIPTNSVLGFSFLHILTNTCCLLICLWWPFWPVWSGWYIMVVLICISLMASRADHPFICLWALFMSSMVKCVFRSFAHFLIGFFVFLGVVWVLYIFWRLNPCLRYHCKIYVRVQLVPFSFHWCFFSHTETF